MAEQGLATDMYSLSALQNVNAEDVAALATFMAGMESAGPQSAPRAVEESLAVLRQNLGAANLTPQDVKTLRRLAELVASDDARAAIEVTKKELHASKGGDAVAGAALAALLQVKSGLPTALLFADVKGGTMLQNEDAWEFEHRGYTYSFRVDEVWNGMVYLSASGRERT